jgi:hypothetical protein
MHARVPLFEFTGTKFLASAEHIDEMDIENIANRALLPH